MADDWIKVRVCLPNTPKVGCIVSRVSRDRLQVTGALILVWGAIQEVTEDGKLPGYSLEDIDAIARIPGFGKAMVEVKWLIDNGAQGLEVPEFEEHMSKSAKSRAENAKRQRRLRAVAQNEAHLSRNSRDKKRSPSSLSYVSDSDSSSGGGAGGDGPHHPEETLAPDQRWLSYYTRVIFEAFPKRLQTSPREFWPAVAEALDRIQTGADETPVAGKSSKECIEWLAGRAREYGQSPVGRGKFAKHAPGWVKEAKYLEAPEAWERTADAGRARGAEIHAERATREFED